MEMKQHLISALVSAIISVSVCLTFSAARHNLPVRWQYDEARAEQRRRDAEEKERQRAAAEYARTNKPVLTISGSPITDYNSIIFFDTSAVTNITWTGSGSIWSGAYVPTFDAGDIELGFRLDGVVLFRTPPEAPRPKVTNNVPIL